PRPPVDLPTADPLARAPRDGPGRGPLPRHSQPAAALLSAAAWCKPVERTARGPGLDHRRTADDPATRVVGLRGTSGPAQGRRWRPVRRRLPGVTRLDHAD